MIKYYRCCDRCTNRGSEEGVIGFVVGDEDWQGRGRRSLRRGGYLDRSPPGGLVAFRVWETVVTFFQQGWEGNVVSKARNGLETQDTGSKWRGRWVGSYAC